MARKSGKGDLAPTIIIRREEVVEGGHHGGAWKVAYADFVTAMMAFFLLMWLLNATTEDQRRGLADYFAAQGQMAHSTSGTGAPFGGRTPYEKGSLVSDRGAMSVIAGKATAQADTEDDDADLSPQPLPARTVDRQRTDAPAEKALGSVLADMDIDRLPSETIAEKAAKAVTEQDDKRRRADAERREKASFEQAAQQIREAVRADPALAALARQMAIDITPDGLRIQLLDEDKTAMFATGSSVLNDRAKLLLQKIAPVLAKLTEGISIAGHTDAAPYKGIDRSNWELSSERAQATRRVLVESGLQEPRFRSVTGNADRDLLLPAEPLAAANRRIAIMVLRTPSPRTDSPPVAPRPVP